MNTRLTVSRRAACAILFGFCGFASTSLADAAWQRTLTSRPGKAPALRPLTADYSFGWSGVKAADARARFSRSGGQYVLGLSAKTSGLARALWRMDTEGVSVVNASTLRPVKLEQTEKYARNTVNTTVRFTPEGVKRLKVETPSDVQPKERSFKLGDLHDLHSAFLFIRSHPLKPGETLRLCVYPGSSPYLAEVKVGQRDKMKAAGREWTTIPCEIRLRKIEKDMELADHKKFKSATVWLSDDRDRLVLRIEAQVHVGKIWAELERVSFAGARTAAAD